MNHTDHENVSSGVAREIPTVDILGARIHDISLGETLELLESMALSGQPHHVMTVNPEFIMIARKDEEFRGVLARASLAVPDGVGVLLAARILGLPLRERVTGIDTVTRFARVAAQSSISLFFLGAAPGVAERVAGRLQRENPALRVAGTYAGSPDPSEEDEICRRIEAARPHVLLVAYGPPKQDLWIARTISRLKVPVAMGVGGTFDFIAGVVPRAPAWMQKAGLEWLYRLKQEPRRWRRQLSLLRFVAAVMMDRFFGAHAG